MIDITKMFENLPESQVISEASKELCNKLMELKTPMGFDNEFATDEQLNTLETELLNLLSLGPARDGFVQIISYLPPIKSNGRGFI